MPRSTNYDVSKFEVNFDSCPYQFELALDTLLVLNSDYSPEVPDEVYLEFDGQPIRWINGDEEYLSLLVCPLKTDDHPSAYDLCQRFLNHIVVENQLVPIRERESVLVGKTIMPSLVNAPRVQAIHQHPHEFLLRDTTSGSPQKELALSLFREGQAADSAFYKYLNYYKTCLVAFIKTDRNGHEYVDHDAFYKWVESLSLDKSALLGLTGSLGKYLKALRDSIGHVEILSSGAASVNPANQSDHRRITAAIGLMKEAATKAATTLF